MEVIVHKRFLKELEGLPKHVIIAADKAIDLLRESKTLADTNLDYKKIAGRKNENFYRIRIGQYRMGIKLIRPSVIVITIFHRQDNYQSFP